MPFGVDPETLLIVAIVGGIGAAATYTTFHQAEKVMSGLPRSFLVEVATPE